MNRTSTTTQYETREETICWRYGKNREFQARSTYTVQVPVGTPEYKIPARNEPLTLDMSKVAEALARNQAIQDELAEVQSNY